MVSTLGARTRRGARVEVPDGRRERLRTVRRSLRVGRQVVFEGLFTPSHLIIILVIALVVLGPRRLPEAGRSIGSAMRGFKDSIASSADDADDEPAIGEHSDERQS